MNIIFLFFYLWFHCDRKLRIEKRSQKLVVHVSPPPPFVFFIFLLEKNKNRNGKDFHAEKSITTNQYLIRKGLCKIYATKENPFD